MIKIRKKHLGKFGKTFVVLTILVSLLLNSLAFGVKPANAWYSTYEYRKLLTIDHTKVGTGSGGGTLSYFPVLVSFTDTALIYDAAGANGHHVRTTQGYDIVFTDTSDNLLPFERELYVNTTGQIVMWVRITTLNYGTDDTFYMYYGKASDTEHQQATTVWNDGGSNYYKAVWHMDEDPTGSAPQLQDSTASNLDATTANMENTDDVAAKVYNGQYFNSGATTDEVADFTSTNMGTAHTFSYWLDWKDSGDGLILAGESVNAPTDAANRNYATYLDATNIYYSAGSYNYATVAHGGLNSGTFYHIGIIRNGTSVSFYKNGAQIGTTQTLALSQNNPLAISRFADYANGQTFPSTAIVDEMHMSTTNRSADWIKTEYNNQNVPGPSGTGPFIKTVGNEEAVPEMVILLIPLALAAPFIIRRMRRKKLAYALALK